MNVRETEEAIKNVHNPEKHHGNVGYTRNKTKTKTKKQKQNQKQKKQPTK